SGGVSWLPSLTRGEHPQASEERFLWKQGSDRSLTMPVRRRKMMGLILAGCGVVGLAGCVYLAFSVARALRPYLLETRLIDTITSSRDRADPGLVKERLDEGAHVNATDDLGDTPLILVARYGYMATARLLLEQGADVNACDKEGMSALMEAAKRGHAAAVE